MGLESLTEESVREAMREFDDLGLQAFCERYGLSRVHDSVVVDGRRRYSAPAIAAAAHGLVPGGEPLTSDEVADELAVKKRLGRLGFLVQKVTPPPWRRDELVLACAALFENDRKALRAGDPRAVELSRVLRSMGIRTPGQYGTTYRSPASVQRKLYDLQTRLQEYTGVPTRGGHLDTAVLTEFEQDPAAMMAEAATIRARVNGGAEASPVEPAEAEAAAPEVERAWSLFSAGGARKYGGNGGYPDVLGEQYVYDNQVSNSRRVAVGDLIVVRDADQVLGVSRVERIDAQAGVPKPQKVCPTCGGTRFDERKRQLPKYRCRRPTCQAEFDEPGTATNDVTQFVASYGRGWRSLAGAITWDELQAHLLDQAPQNAIRPLERDALLALLQGRSVPPPPHLPAGKKREAPKGGHREGTARFRFGQDRFKTNLLQEHGVRCAITGPCPEQVLEAAHLRKFAEHESHEDGLLLRVDIHRLFDRGLLAIHPDTLTVVIAPTLADYDDYAKLEGLPVTAAATAPDAIRDHFHETTAAWA